MIAKVKTGLAMCHKLIGDLVDPPTRSVACDRQIAIQIAQLTLYFMLAVNIHRVRKKRNQ